MDDEDGLVIGSIGPGGTFIMSPPLADEDEARAERDAFQQLEDRLAAFVQLEDRLTRFFGEGCTTENMEKLDRAIGLLARYEAAFGPEGWVAQRKAELRWDVTGSICVATSGLWEESNLPPLEAVEAAMKAE